MIHVYNTHQLRLLKDRAFAQGFAVGAFLTTGVTLWALRVFG
jgi:hypothetical protein